MEITSRRAFTYKALNRLIQGSAADQTKQAMIECYKAGFKPLLQIHDELCFSIDKENDIKNVKEIMENAIGDFKVPSKVDIALGRSWEKLRNSSPCKTCKGQKTLFLRLRILRLFGRILVLIVLRLRWRTSLLRSYAAF